MYECSRIEKKRDCLTTFWTLDTTRQFCPCNEFEYVLIFVQCVAVKNACLMFFFFLCRSIDVYLLSNIVLFLFPLGVGGVLIKLIRQVSLNNSSLNHVSSCILLKQTWSTNIEHAEQTLLRCSRTPTHSFHLICYPTEEHIQL